MQLDFNSDIKGEHTKTLVDLYSESLASEDLSLRNMGRFGIFRLLRLKKRAIVKKSIEKVEPD